MSHSGKTIVVTGASRGIGEATARHFGALGANVVLAARSTGRIEAIAAEIGDRALAMSCDVADRAQVTAVLNAAYETFGSIDIIVNNAAAIEPIGLLADVDPDAWDQVIDVNVKGVFYAMHFAIPKMVQAGGGTIINISSGAAYGVLEGWAHYCASKAAVLQLTRAGHKEYGGAGIRMIGLSPGTVATEMQVAIKKSGINPVSDLEVSDHIPPSDVAVTIDHLCGVGGNAYLGQDFKLNTPEGRAEVGLLPRQ